MKNRNIIFNLKRFVLLVFLLTGYIVGFAQTVKETQYSLNITATLANNTIATNGGTLNLIFSRTNGPAIPGVDDTFTVPVTYSGMNNTTGTGAVNRWDLLSSGAGNLYIVPKDGKKTGGIYHKLPSKNKKRLTFSTGSPDASNVDKVFNHYIGNGTIDKIGNFSISFGNFPSTFPAGVSVVNKKLQVHHVGNMQVQQESNKIYNGFYLKPDAQTDLATTYMAADSNYFDVLPGQTYTYWYSAFDDGTYTLATNTGYRGTGITASLTLSHIVQDCDVQQADLSSFNGQSNTQNIFANNNISIGDSRILVTHPVGASRLTTNRISDNHYSGEYGLNLGHSKTATSYSKRIETHLTFSKTVKDLTFRINDMDAGDNLRVLAYDENNNLIPITASNYYLYPNTVITYNPSVGATGEFSAPGQDYSQTRRTTIDFSFPDVYISKVEFHYWDPDSNGSYTIAQIAGIDGEACPACSIVDTTPIVENLSNTCPFETVNLNDAHTGTIPSGAELLWFTSATRDAGTQVSNHEAVEEGSYYAFYYESANDCWSPVSDEVIVTINECADCTDSGETSVNLNSMFTGTVPHPDVVLEWWSTPDRQPGTKVDNPTVVTESGTYYVFFYDTVNECYNTDYSTSAVTVVILPPCYINMYATPDINQVPEGVTATGNVLDNDYGEGDLEVTEFTYMDSTGTIQSGIVSNPTDVYVLDENDNPVKAGEFTLNPDGTYTFVPEEGFTGTVPLEYTAEDDNGNTDSTTLTIEVIPSFDPNGNNPPIAQDDTYTVEQGETATVNVLANDSDPDGDTLTVIEVLGYDSAGNPTIELDDTPKTVYDADGNEAGVAHIDNEDNIVFTPKEGYYGETPFEYTISDGNGGTDSATAYVNVIPDNESDSDIYAHNDANTAPKGVAMDGDVSENDEWGGTDAGVETFTYLDENGDVKTASAGDTVTIYDEFGQKAGELTLDEDGAYDFIPEPDYVGTVVVEYTVSNFEGDEDSAKLYLTTLDVVAADILAEDDVNQVPEGVTAVGNVLDNDKGDNIKVTKVTIDDVEYPLDPVDGVIVNMPEGKLTILPDGSYTFKPEDDFTGDVPTINYTIEDDTGGIDNADLNIVVIPDMLPGNNPPIAIDDTQTTSQGVPTEGNVLSNDSDPDGDDIEVTGITYLDTDGDPQQAVPGQEKTIYDESGVKAGKIQVNTDGTFTFEPDPDFTGDVSIDYTITDGEETDEATLVITVLPEDNPYISSIYTNDDAQSAPKGTVMTGDVSENDTWGGDNPRVDEITYISDDSGTVSTITPGTIVDIYDEEGNKAGTLEIDSEGKYTYTPEPYYVGTVSVLYKVINDDGDEDTSTLYLTTLDMGATEVLAVDDINQVPQNVMAHGNVLDNDETEVGNLEVESFTYLNAAGDETPGALGGEIVIYDDNGDKAGSIVLLEDGKYSFDPENGYTGVVSIDYVAINDNGDTDSATLTIIVVPSYVTAENNPPVAQNDTQTTPFNTPTEGDVLANDSDPDGDEIKVTDFEYIDGSGNIAYGTVGDPVTIYDESGNKAGEFTLEQDGTFEFVPESGYTGEVPVKYYIEDDEQLSDSAVLVITVLPEDSSFERSIFANDDANIGPKGQMQDGNVKDNDTWGGANPRVTGFTYLDGSSSPQNAVADTFVTVYDGEGYEAGQLKINSDGSYIYNPLPDFVGTAVVEYKVINNDGDSDTAKLYLTTLNRSDIPDYSPTIVVTPNNNIKGAVDMKIVLNIYELEGVESDPSKPIRVLLQKDFDFSFSYDTNLTTITGIGPTGFGINNSDWDFTDLGGYYMLTYNKGVFPAGGLSKIGFEGTFDKGDSAGLGTFTVTIAPGSGGEENDLNNTDYSTVSFLIP